MPQEGFLVFVRLTQAIVYMSYGLKLGWWELTEICRGYREAYEEVQVSNTLTKSV